MLESGRKGHWICLHSQLLCPSSKKAQPGHGYAKGVSGGDRSTSSVLYGTWVKIRVSVLKIYNENIFYRPVCILPQLGYGENRNSDWSMIYCSDHHAMLSTTLSKLKLQCLWFLGYQLWFQIQCKITKWNLIFSELVTPCWFGRSFQPGWWSRGGGRGAGRQQRGWHSLFSSRCVPNKIHFFLLLRDLRNKATHQNSKHTFYSSNFNFTFWDHWNVKK